MVIAFAACGHYAVPTNATIHRFYFEDTNFDDFLDVECARDDRIQLWFNFRNKKSDGTDTTWYIANNTHKDIVYMEYQDTKETHYKGMKGEEYEAVNKKALMDSIEHMKMHREHGGFESEELRRHMLGEEIPEKPRKLTLVQFHCYKVQEEEIQIIMSHVPPRNFIEMRRQLKEQRRGLAELEKEPKVEKFFTLYVKVHEKEFAQEVSAEDL